MEIETSKNKMIQTGKRRHNQLLEQFQKDINTKTKKIKVSIQSKPTYHLSSLEKSFVYLNSALGSEPKEIASSINRDPRSIKSFIQNAKTDSNAFVSQDYKKGRWKKGNSKLDQRHKEFLNRWIQAGTIVSAKDAYLRLNSIQSVKSISYNPVRVYLKSLGKFVKPGLKPEVSTKNKSARLKYCLKFRNFNFQKVLFGDESIFHLNTNYQKSFHFRGQKAPKKQKFNPNIKIMVWGGVSYYGKTSLFIINGTWEATIS